MSVKIFYPSFTINIAKKSVKRKLNSYTKVSRKCLAVIKIIEGDFKAIINIDKHHIKLHEGDELSNEQLVLPLTEQSFDLKGRQYVWLTHKDKYNNDICLIRDIDYSLLHPGLPHQYKAIKENLLLSGYIVRKNGRHYFNYENVISFNYMSSHRTCEPKIDESKPLFNK